MKNNFFCKSAAVYLYEKPTHKSKISSQILYGEKFKILLNSDSYKMLLNHIDHNIVEVKTTDSQAAYEVTILGKGKNYYKFRWIVEKYEVDGPLKDCWLTTAVSQPIPIGSSI